MNVLITGVQGFVGQEVKAEFEKWGHAVFPVPKEDLLLGGKNLDRLAEQAEVIINLAGSGIRGPWTEKRMIDILESRRVTTRNLVRAVNRAVQKPKLFINASAVGIYRPDVFCDEESVDYGENFLSRVLRAWEAEVRNLKQVRQVILRFGIIIGTGGGILKKLLPLMKSRIAVVLGDGRQEFPLIHIEDVTGFMLYLLNHQEEEGVYNIVIPNCVNYREFIRFLTFRKKPLFRLRIPAWILETVLGEAATVFTRSPHVIPWRMMHTEYVLKRRTIREVLEN